MEGYGRFNPAHLFSFIEKLRFKNLLEEISKLDAQYRLFEGQEMECPPKLSSQYSKLMFERVQRFPDEEGWLLPTSFGNTIRAFEVYSRLMYGLDMIPGWYRLLTVIPDQWRDLIDSAKANVDFWVNIHILSLIILIEFIGIMVFTPQLEFWWGPVIVLGVSILAYERAKRAAVNWGEYVKSAFDVFLPELRRKMHFPSPATKEEEKSLWAKFSQAIIYARPECMPDRVISKESLACTEEKSDMVRYDSEKIRSNIKMEAYSD
jgi:hypothetical protein